METIIEVQAFGDFDIMYTECVMVSDIKFDINELQKEFCEIENIPSFRGLKGSLYELTYNFIAFLELKGFKKLQTTPIYFCD